MEKKTAPKGSKFFPFRVDPFQKGNQNNFDRVASPEIRSVRLKLYYYAKTEYGNIIGFIMQNQIMEILFYTFYLLSSFVLQ